MRVTRKRAPNCVFASGNEWGIPTLDIELQGDAIDLPFEAWGSRSRRRQQPGTYHFYVDDYRFSAIWKSPDRLPDTGCLTAVEPNLSMNLASPRAWVLWATYQRRWIARYWQSRGVRIFADLNIPPEFADIACLGIPPGWAAFCTHGYNTQLEQLEGQFAIALGFSKSPQFVVYGGGRRVKELCWARSWLWFPEDSDLKRGRIVSESGIPD